MEFEGMISNDPKMLRIFDLVDKMRDIDCPVLIVGETGTGKELLARAIHRRSNRRDKPFLAINCAALPESLLESELFGHERGAFTGAVTSRKGIFEQADGGTLFLDEIAETTVNFQAKLLRVIQEGEFRPLGSTQNVSVDVRVISATNANIPELIEKKEFREDLYYRLNVMTIELPRLADRIDDVPLLANYFAQRAAAKIGRTLEGIADDVIAKLVRYSWPGNVRELENMIETAVFTASVRTSGEQSPLVLELCDFPTLAEKVARNPRHTRLTDIPFYEARAAFEREYLAALLARYNKNISAASRAAKISRKSLTIKAKRYGLL